MGFWERTWLNFAEPFAVPADGDGLTDIPMRWVAYLFVALFKSVILLILFFALLVHLGLEAFPAPLFGLGLMTAALMVIGYFRAPFVRRSVEVRNGRVTLIRRSPMAEIAATTDITDFECVAYRLVELPGRSGPGYCAVELRHADPRRSVPLSVIQGNRYPVELLQDYGRAFSLQVLEQGGKRVDPAMLTASLTERAEIDGLTAEYDPVIPEEVSVEAGEEEIVVNIPSNALVSVTAVVATIIFLILITWRGDGGLHGLLVMVGWIAAFAGLPLVAAGIYWGVTEGGARRLRLTPETVTFERHRADIGWDANWTLPMGRIASVSVRLSNVVIRTTDWQTYNVFFGANANRARWLKKYLVAAILTAKRKEDGQR